MLFHRQIETFAVGIRQLAIAKIDQNIINSDLPSLVSELKTLISVDNRVQVRNNIMLDKGTRIEF